MGRELIPWLKILVVMRCQFLLVKLPSLMEISNKILINYIINMKTKIFLLLLAFVSILPCSYTSAGNANVKPEKMRILYLGGYSDWTRDCPTFKTPEDFQKTVDLRMDAFGTLLRKYFGTVKVMKAADYKPEMSKGFDVTIFDGVPPELEKAVEVYDGNGKIVKYTNPRYLPYDFSYPSITIGEIGPT